MTTQQSNRISNPAGISLLLSQFMVNAAVKAVAGQSADGQFSWMDGEAGELDGETLAEVMSTAIHDAENLEWDTLPSGLKRSVFPFENEELFLYLVEPEFVVAAIADIDTTDVPLVDRTLAAIAEKLKAFI